MAYQWVDKTAEELGNFEPFVTDGWGKAPLIESHPTFAVFFTATSLQLVVNRFRDRERALRHYSA